MRIFHARWHNIMLCVERTGFGFDMLPCSELHPTLCVWCPCSPSTSLSPSLSRSHSCFCVHFLRSFLGFVDCFMLLWFSGECRISHETNNFSHFFREPCEFFPSPCTLFLTLSLSFFLFFSPSFSVSYNFLILCVVFLPFLCSSFLYSVFSAN